MLGAATLEGAKLATADAPMDAMTAQVFVVGMVVSGVVGYLTVKFFLRYLVNHTLERVCGVPARAGRRDVGVAGGVMLAWLRRRFITGFFVTVPLIVSVAALVWGFRVVDGVTAPFYQRLLGRDVPGLGLLTGALAVLLVGVLAANVIGRRVLQRLEHWLLLVPVFRTVYAPVKQLIAAFSPDNETGFKQVVLVDDPARGHGDGLSDARVHRSRIRPGSAGPWRPSTCRPTTCISATSSFFRGNGCSFPI